MNGLNQVQRSRWGHGIAGFLVALVLVGLGAWFSRGIPKLIVKAEAQTAATTFAAGAKQVEKVTFSEVALEELARPKGVVDFVAFGGEPMRIQVNKVKGVGAQSSVSLGIIAGDSGSQVVMARENGIWAGSVSTGNGRYFSITYAGEETYWLTELGAVKAGECDNCQSPEDSKLILLSEDGVGLMEFGGELLTVADIMEQREMRLLLRMSVTAGTMMAAGYYAEHDSARRTLLRRIAVRILAMFAHG